MSKESEAREQLWYGVPFKKALQDVIARNDTGYSYSELEELIADSENEDSLESEELKSVDATVNILSHLFVFYHSYRPEEVSHE